LIRGYDVALVQLSSAVTNVTPAQVYRGHSEFNQLGTFVGVGRTGTGLTGDTIDDGIKRAGTNVIDGTMRRSNHGLLEAISKIKRTTRTFAADFDEPGNPLNSHIGSPDPTDLEYLISRGDSGGPVFIDDGTGPKIAGIHSYGEIFDERDDSDYGDLTGHTRVSIFAKWIDKVTGSAKYQRKLHFVTPTADEQAAFTDFDPSSRDIPATPFPEPSFGIIPLAAVAMLMRRARRGAMGIGIER